MTVDIKQIPQIVQEAKNAAYYAASNYLHNEMNGQDSFPCGFAWIGVSEKGSTKLGRALMQNGFGKSISWWSGDVESLGFACAKY